MENTATNLNADQKTKKVSMFSRAAQALSRPVNAPEYLADKLIGGLITTGCMLGIQKGIDKIKESRAIKDQIPVRK